MGPGILYLHGFRSSPASWKARVLTEALRERAQSDRLLCPALSSEPRAAMAEAERLIAGWPGPLTLVGSSLGGFYATYLAEKYGLRAVLINPAVAAPRLLEDYLGAHAPLHGGPDFELTAAHLDQLRALDVPTLSPQRYLLLVETGDEVLDYRQALLRYAGAKQVVLEGGDHSFTRFPEYLPQLFEFCGL